MLFVVQLSQVNKCVKKTLWRKPAFSDMFENNAFSYGVWGIMGLAPILRGSSTDYCIPASGLR